MLTLRIRQAEVALHDGRLDEAYELVSRSEALRSHRRGQSLVTRLVDALVKRGHEHLSSDRFQQALLDCEKAARLGGNLPAAAELRSMLTEAMEVRNRFQRRQARALHAAREAIEGGQLAAGQHWLAQAGDQSRALMLLQDVNVRRNMVESSIQSAQAALERGELDLAAAELIAARAADAADPRLVELCTRACTLMRQRATATLLDGRLDLADQLVQRLARLDPQGIETQQLQRSLEQARLAWQSIDAGQPRRAEETLRRLSILLPDAKWVREALKYAAQAEEALQWLRGSPLGLCSSPRSMERPTEPLEEKGPPPVAKQPEPIAPRAASDELPSRFVIQVDGAGSFVVLRQPVVTLGPVSSSRIPDVGLIAEPGAPVITLERNDDDYFIRATGPIAVNDRPTSNKLLMAGDRIAISPRCRLAFNLPHAASTTATIDLSGGGRFPRADLRRVILLDRDIVIGPGNGTHIRCDQLSGNIMLIVRNGRLFVHGDTLVTVDGKPMDRSAGVPLGGHVAIGGLSFVVTRG